MISNAHRFGISRISVIVIIICAVIIISIAVVVLRKARHYAWEGVEASYLRQIHHSWVNFANSNKGLFPNPSLLDRPSEPAKDQNSESLDPWDASKNTTANIYSALIAQRYFNTTILISPFERNPVVVVDHDYNYSAYDPDMENQWDSNFVADLETGSNVSFAHMPAVGKERLNHWGSSAGDKIALLGNRGPVNGIANADLFSCRPNGSWDGTFVFGDGHFEFIKDFKIGMKSTSSFDTNDNPFNFDDEADLNFDQAIAFTQKVQENQAVLQHD